MNNIYFNLYSNIDMINKMAEKKDKKLYINCNPPLKEFIWKESSKYKQFKNKITDSFLERDSPFEEDIYYIKSIGENIFMRTKKRIINNSIKDGFIKSYLSSDSFNTFIEVHNKDDISKIYKLVQFSKNYAYIQDGNKILISTDMINFNIYASFLEDILSFYVTNDNDLYINFYTNKSRNIIDNRFFKINNLGKRELVNFSDNISVFSTSKFVSNNENIYFYNNYSVYYSNDKINFKMIQTQDSRTRRLSLGYFLSNGSHVYLSDELGSSEGAILITNDFINYKTILELNDFFSYKQDVLNVIDDVIYVCSKAGVRYSNDYGNTWSLYKIPDATSITKHKDKLLVTCLNGIYFI